jgi:ribonuclease G
MMENNKSIEIYANRSFDEIRIAVLENSKLVELFWERSGNTSLVGNIYKGVVENVLPGISSAFINIGLEKNAYIYISDVVGDKRQGIDNILKTGQEVMVQIIKDAISTKGMKVTMEITIPAKYLVLTPFSEHIHVSKSIENPDERERLNTIINSIMEATKKRYGCIVRTEAEGVGEEELKKEYKYLLRLWEGILKKYESPISSL